jgi:pSer/pThr/pTyr-binding forkhead associated (FHA) protein
MPTLIIQTGKHRGQKLVLPDAEVVVGRDDDCQIRLASSDVSRRHCAIRPSPEGMLIRDLGSRNGTQINDVPIEEETLLKPGDILRIGPMQFQAIGKKGVQEPPPAAGPQPGETKMATDDAIANWLTGDEPGEHPVGPGDTTIVPNKPPAEPAEWTVDWHTTLKSNDTVRIDVPGTGIIRQMRVGVEPPTPELLCGLRMQLTWDQEGWPSVDVPVGYFFGNAFSGQESQLTSGAAVPGKLDRRLPKTSLGPLTTIP